MDKLIRFFFKSTPITRTSTTSPTDTASSGCLIYLSVISEICTSHTIQLAEGAAEFDTHAYVKQAYKETPQFAEKLKFYQDKYLTKIDEVEAME